MVLISHDLHVVMARTDTVICLNGHVCCQGTPDSVAASGNMRRCSDRGRPKRWRSIAMSTTMRICPMERCEMPRGNSISTITRMGPIASMTMKETTGMLESFFTRALIAGWAGGGDGAAGQLYRLAAHGLFRGHDGPFGHSGVALALFFSFSPVVGVFAIAVMVALILAFLQRRGTLSADSLLGGCSAIRRWRWGWCWCR